MRNPLKIFAILLIAVSCNEPEAQKKVEISVDAFLNSQSFKNLNVSIDQLDISKYLIKDVGENVTSILIPFKDKNELKYIIGHIKNYNNPTQEFLITLTFKYNTDKTYDELSKAIEKKNYTGGLEITTSNFSYFNFSVMEGKFVLMQSKINKNNRVEACSGTVGSDAWVQNVANCAASSINNQGPFSYTLCIIDLPMCWAAAVVDCVVGGCAQL